MISPDTFAGVNLYYIIFCEFVKRLFGKNSRLAPDCPVFLTYSVKYATMFLKIFITQEYPSNNIYVSI